MPCHATPQVIDHRSTDYIRNAVNPQWTESLLLWVPCSAPVDFPPSVRITMWDKDRKKMDEHISTVTLPLPDEKARAQSTAERAQHSSTQHSTAPHSTAQHRRASAHSRATMRPHAMP